MTVSLKRKATERIRKKNQTKQTNYVTERGEEHKKIVSKNKDDVDYDDRDDGDDGDDDDGVDDDAKVQEREKRAEKKNKVRKKKRRRRRKTMASMRPNSLFVCCFPPQHHAKCTAYTFVRVATLR